MPADPSPVIQIHEAGLFKWGSMWRNVISETQKQSKIFHFESLTEVSIPGSENVQIQFIFVCFVLPMLYILGSDSMNYPSDIFIRVDRSWHSFAFRFSVHRQAKYKNIFLYFYVLLIFTK